MVEEKVQRDSYLWFHDYWPKITRQWKVGPWCSPIVFVLGQTSSIEIARCCLIVHHTEDPIFERNREAWGRKNENHSCIPSKNSNTNYRSSAEMTGSLDVWELSSDFLHKHRQIVDFVLVDAHCGHTGHEGELDMRCVVVTVQNQSAKLLQLTQQSRIPIKTEWRRTYWTTAA